MKKLFKYSIYLLVFFIILITSISFLLDFNKYKGHLTRYINESTGYDLSISGDIKVSLLPQIRLSSYDIKIKNPDNKIFMDINKISADLSITKLIFGKVFIDKLRVFSPKVQVKNKKMELTNVNVNSKQRNLKVSSKKITQNLSNFIKKIEVKDGFLELEKPNNKITISNIDFDANIFGKDYLTRFKLSFNLLDEKIKLKGSLQELSKNNILSLILNTDYGILEINGDIDFNNVLFKGNFYSKGKYKNNNYVMHANSLINKEKLEISNIKISLDKMILLGLLDFKLGLMSGHFSLKSADDLIAITSKFSCKENLDLLKGFISLNIKKVTDLLNKLPIDISIKSIPRIFKDKASVKTSFELDMKNMSGIKIYDLSVTIGQFGIGGSVKFHLSDKLPMYVYDISINNPYILWSLFSDKLKKIGLQGYCSGTMDSVETDTKLYVSDSILHLQGEVRDIIKSPKADLQMNFYVKDFIKLTAFLNINHNEIFHIKAFDIFTKIKLVNNLFDIDISESLVQLGDNYTGFTGKILYNLNNLEKSSVKFNIDNIDFTVFSNNILPRQKISQIYTSKKKLLYSQNEWSKNITDLSYLKNITGSIAFSINQIKYNELCINNLKLLGLSKNGHLLLKQLSGDVGEGSFNIKGNLNINNKQSCKLQINAEKIKINNWNINNKLFVSAKNNFNMQFSSEGYSFYDYINNLSGNINVTSSEGILDGFNLEKIIHNVQNLDNMRSFLQLFNNLFSEGKTNFSELKLNMDIKQGNIDVKRALLTSGKSIVLCTGNVNLINYNCDILGNVSLNINDFPDFGFNVIGNLRNPAYNLNINQLQKYLLGKFANNVLGNLINKDSNKGSAQNLNSLIKGLFS